MFRFTKYPRFNKNIKISSTSAATTDVSLYNRSSSNNTEASVAAVIAIPAEAAITAISAAAVAARVRQRPMSVACLSPVLHLPRLQRYGLYCIIFIFKYIT